jgi:hypothetical protein
MLIALGRSVRKHREANKLAQETLGENSGAATTGVRRYFWMMMWTGRISLKPWPKPARRQVLKSLPIALERFGVVRRRPGASALGAGGSAIGGTDVASLDCGPSAIGRLQERPWQAACVDEDPNPVVFFVKPHGPTESESAKCLKNEPWYGLIPVRQVGSRRE